MARFKAEKYNEKTFQEDCKKFGKVPKNYEKSYWELHEKCSNILDFYGKKVSERNTLLDTLQRLQAEFENYKKRTEKEKSEFVKFSNSNLISKLLPILDNFELALKNKHKKDDFIQGTEMIYNEFIQILKEIGLEKIQAQNQKFDPYLHEALLQEKSNKDNIVLEELQTGYKLNDKVLRHTKVKISKMK